MQTDPYPAESESLGGQPVQLPGSDPTKLYIDPETLAAVPEELREAWINYMKKGFENNQLMFARTLEAFMRPYNITVGMYVMIFIIGILFFCMAAYLGLTGQQPSVAIVFGGLSVATFLMFFVRQPVQALALNLEFITWLGVAFNTYWTRLMYISNKNTVQNDLKAAADDYCSMVERIINKHARLQNKLPGDLQSASTEKPEEKDETNNPVPGVSPVNP